MLTNSTKKFARTAAATLVVAASTPAVSGCGIGDITGTTKLEPSGPAAVLEVDGSGSTAKYRLPGGPYEQDALATLHVIARADGSLWTTTAGGNAAGEGNWVIDNASFTTRIGGGNENLAAAARADKAKREVGGKLKALVARTVYGGSDVLGLMTRARDLLAGVPKERQRIIVLLSDGAIAVPGRARYDIYRDPPYTAVARQKLIRRFRNQGELPNLTPPGAKTTKVYIGGLGAVSNRDTARAVVLLWKDLVRAMNGKLVTADSRLQLDGFTGE